MGTPLDTDENQSDAEKPKTRSWGRGRKRQKPNIVDSDSDSDSAQSAHSLTVESLPTPTYSNDRVASKTNPLTNINDKIYGLNLAQLVQIAFIFKTCANDKKRDEQLTKG